MITLERHGYDQMKNEEELWFSPFEALFVVWIDSKSEIGQNILDLGSVMEAELSDHKVRYTHPRGINLNSCFDARLA